MVQAPAFTGLYFAVRRIADVPVEARPSRTAQSAGAGGLLADLRRGAALENGPSSKAHSRGLVAAAAAPKGRVGIDIEYCAPERDIIAIAAWLSGAAPQNAAAAYRTFTFYEAYFKAFGETPTRPLLTAATEASVEIFHNLERDFSVLHQRLESNFVLTLVWSGGGAPKRLYLG